MKKVIKISLVAVAALLLFLNVGLNLNGNKVEGINLTTNAQTAQADGECYLSIQFMQCFCKVLDYYCVGLCPNGYTEMLCETVVIEGK